MQLVVAPMVFTVPMGRLNWLSTKKKAESILCPNLEQKKKLQTSSPQLKDMFTLKEWQSKKIKKFFKNPLTNKGFCVIIITERKKERGKTK